MSRVRVKICGITRPADALLAVEAGADAIGLVFAESPRQVTPEQAARIVEGLPPWVTPVGVFVNTEPRRVLEIVRQVRLGAAQLHGEESPADVAEVASAVTVIKSYRIGGLDDLAAAVDHAGRARPAACLVDARSDHAYGGTGEKAPWDLLPGRRSALWPLVLAGGLRPENVAEAIRVVRPYAVDASSGVESEPGRKDPERVRTFVHNALSVTVDYSENGENA